MRNETVNTNYNYMHCWHMKLWDRKYCPSFVQFNIMNTYILCAWSKNSQMFVHLFNSVENFHMTIFFLRTNAHLCDLFRFWLYRRKCTRFAIVYFWQFININGNECQPMTISLVSIHVHKAALHQTQHIVRFNLFSRIYNLTHPYYAIAYIKKI